MIKLMTIVAAMTAMTTPLAASSGTETMGTNLFVILFLGFGALIAICQLIPGLVLFFAMMKGLFRMAVKKPLAVPHDPDATV